MSEVVTLAPDVFDIVRPFIQAIDSGRIFSIIGNTAIAETEHTYPVALHLSEPAFSKFFTGLISEYPPIFRK